MKLRTSSGERKRFGTIHGVRAPRSTEGRTHVVARIVRCWRVERIFQRIKTDTFA